MTDRIRHLTVTLDDDYRDDDIEPIIEAIRMIRGIATITGAVVSGQDHLAREAVRSEIEGALHKAIGSVFTRKNLERKLKEHP